MVISQALAHGRHVALASVLGVGLGDLAAASLSIIGVGTVLAASATAFLVIKWLGAAYLIWIGIKMWRSPITPLTIDMATRDKSKTAWPIFRDAFLVTLFNPKGIVFFVAFVPQFISPESAFAPQASIFVLTFVILGMVNAAVYAMLASAARNWIKRPEVLRGATWIGASFLISAGLASAFVRKASAT
jgi:threonine/homoserine/homoserine lactone efflux protein